MLVLGKLLKNFQKCTPLLIFMTLIFLSNASFWYIRHQANLPNNTHTEMQIKSAVFYVVVAVAIYVMCLQKINLTAAWIVVFIYFMWICMELVLSVKIVQAGLHNKNWLLPFSK